MGCRSLVPSSTWDVGEGAASLPAWTPARELTPRKALKREEKIDKSSLKEQNPQPRPIIRTLEGEQLDSIDAQQDRNHGSAEETGNDGGDQKTR